MFLPADVQGNILRGYRLPVVAHSFGRIEASDCSAWRSWLGALAENLTWGGDRGASSKSGFTVNLGISFAGLALLQPDVAREIAPRFSAFADGMPKRARELGDPDGRYDAWNTRHIWVSVHASSREVVQQGIAAVRRIAQPLVLEQVEPLGQAIAKEGDDGETHWYEHFGFRDDISSPVVEGRPNPKPEDAQGRGKYDVETKTWKPIATGEFFLGEPDESGNNALEGLSAPAAQLLTHGSFAVFRRLYQDVPTFRQYLRKQSSNLRQSAALAACMMGREQNGRPLVNPDGDLADFTYEQDEKGARCPLGAHVRRMNPRLTGRHQLIRRGITFGPEAPAGLDEVSAERPEVDRGLWFVAFNASIEEQFEFVQRRYVNGPAGRLSDARDPIAGCGATRSFAIEGDQSQGRMPRLLLDLPTFVTPQGGQYYFVPSRNGLTFLSGAQPDS